MSADSHTACPRCSGADIEGYSGPEINIEELDNLLTPSSVRENIEYGMVVHNGTLAMYFNYRADCWDCGWHHETTLREPITNWQIAAVAPYTQGDYSTDLYYGIEGDR